MSVPPFSEACWQQMKIDLAFLTTLTSLDNLPGLQKLQNWLSDEFSSSTPISGSAGSAGSLSAGSKRPNELSGDDSEDDSYPNKTPRLSKPTARSDGRKRKRGKASASGKKKASLDAEYGEFVSRYPYNMGLHLCWRIRERSGW